MTDFDIVLPVHKKDIDIIEICLKYLRKNVNNNCNIYIISKNKLTDNAIWIQENIFPFSFNDISYLSFSSIKPDSFLAYSFESYEPNLNTTQ